MSSTNRPRDGFPSSRSRRNKTAASELPLHAVVITNVPKQSSNITRGSGVGPSCDRSPSIVTAENSRASICSRGSNATLSVKKVDDYGEWDLSLHGNFDRTYGLSHSEALDILQDKLEDASQAMGATFQIAKNGKYWWTLKDLKLEVSIRDDTKAVVISTIVHKVKHANILRVGPEARKAAVTVSRSNGSSYSRMTKMMKHNVLLDRMHAGQIASFEGKFIYFRNTALAILDGNRLHQLLESYILNAVEISNDFDMSRANRRRFFKRP